MKKVFFLLTLSLFSISANLTATPKQEAKRLSPATESVFVGALLGEATALLIKTIDYLSNSQIRPAVLGCVSVFQGACFGLNYYNNHPDRKKTSKLLNALTNPNTMIAGLFVLTSAGYPSKGPKFFSLHNTTPAAVGVGYLAAIGCAAALNYNKDKISSIKIKDKDSLKMCSAKSITHGAMLVACSLAGLATAHGINKLL